MVADRAAARIAASQQGIITSAQLEQAGFGPNAVSRRVDGEWLVRVYVGVYRLGPFGGPFGEEMAALLACGARAVISHWTATGVFALRPRVLSPIDITVVGGLTGQRPGIRPHRATSLPPGDVVLRHGLRVTTPARTLLDLAAVAPRDVLERLTEEAQVQRLVSPGELAAMVVRGAGRPGVAKLRAVLDYIDEPLLTRSEGEKRLLGLCRSSALPIPRTNVKRAGWEVDAVWDAQRLVVEVDGRQYHDTGASFERDRRKDADLMLAGYRVLRLTWRRLTREPEQVIALIAAALAAVPLAPRHGERQAPR